jgi:hypothetical protein
VTPTDDVDLLTGIAVLLDAEGLGTYSPDDVLPDDATAIVLARVPDTPDRVICLTPYPVADDDTANAITGIQVRMRAGTDPTALVQLGNDLFGLLHNRQHYTAGTARVQLSWRQSQAWIGQDDRGRMELTANFYFRTTRSGPYLID